MNKLLEKIILGTAEETDFTDAEIKFTKIRSAFKKNETLLNSFGIEIDWDVYLFEIITPDSRYIFSTLDILDRGVNVCDYSVSITIN